MRETKTIFVNRKYKETFFNFSETREQVNLFQGNQKQVTLPLEGLNYEIEPLKQNCGQKSKVLTKYKVTFQYALNVKVISLTQYALLLLLLVVVVVVVVVVELSGFAAYE